MRACDDVVSTIHQSLMSGGGRRRELRQIVSCVGYGRN